MASNSLMFLFISLTSNLFFCSALQCYSCNSELDLENPQCNSTLIEECDSGVEYCTYLYSNNTVKAQTCVQKVGTSTCKSNPTGEIDGEGYKVYYSCCKTNLCYI